MAASSAARLSDIGFSLVIGPPGVFRRTRQYIPAAGPELIADRLADAWLPRIGGPAG
jgi:hypothetical protein